MKSLVAISLFIFLTGGLTAKDVGLKIINENIKSIEVFAGIISMKSNYLSDDELVAQKEALGIVSVGRKIKPGKNVSISLKDVPKRKLYVIFGLVEGGGRTEVLRYNTSTMTEKMTITFEKINLITPSNTFINIAQGLSTVNNVGPYQSIGDVRLTGYFILYNVVTEAKNEVYLLTPSVPIDFTVSESKNFEVSDAILKTATFPFTSRKGDIVVKVPENPDVPYVETVFPPYSKIFDFFGDKNFMYLTWRIVNTRKISAVPSVKDYYSIFTSCKEFEQKQLMDIFYRNFTKTDNAEFHLYFIKEATRTDSIIVYETETEQLDPLAQLLDGDISFPTGNFRLTENKKEIYSTTNVIKDINAVDLTPILMVKVLATGTFKNTVSDAGLMLDLYQYLGNYIQVPTLDENALSISKPSYTISKIREGVTNPDFMKSLEEKLNTEIVGPIPPAILESFVKKLEKK